MTLLVTGAAGFVGRAVVRRLARDDAAGQVRLFDWTPPHAPDDRFEAVSGDILDPQARERALEGVDRVLHLISLPGGSAEADVSLSRRINLDATLALAEGLAETSTSGAHRFVFASSIAVLGAFTDIVDDNTPPAPGITYGAHKLMAEIGLADLHRRGAIETLCLRLPGIVARPSGPSGLKSAFMSEVFHAARKSQAFTFPVSPSATFWMMSADRVAANLLHAFDAPDPGGRAVTLPSLRVSARTLAEALFTEPNLVSYAPDAELEAVFGRYPLLAADQAEAMGFGDDGDIAGLIAAVGVDL